MNVNSYCAMSSSTRIQLAKRLVDWCIHFNGIQRKVCEAKISYISVRDTTQPGRYRWPCLRSDNATTTCSKCHYYSKKEAIIKATEMDKSIKEYENKLKNNKICPHCGKKIVKKQKIDRCLYAVPCGHRLGQIG